jgi:tetratricopeptide (TPR) repeat protein
MFLALLALPALAQGEDEDVEEGETITTRADRSALQATEAVAGAVPPREHGSAKVLLGARALNLEEDFVGRAVTGCELLYGRRYAESKKHFDGMAEDYPGRGIGEMAKVLIYQARMMENFDFRFDGAYQRASDAAIQELTEGLESPGAESWEHFGIGTLKGVQAIHMMRKTQFLPAIWKGVEALDHINEVKALAPDFKDVLLGDGLFKYWRSVVSMDSKALPDFEDERQQGIQDMLTAEKEAVFLGPGATLGLAFTWIEEREMSKALEYTMANHRAYPDNIVNNMVLARVYLYQRRYEDSLGVLRQIQSDDADNRRSWYYTSTVQLRLREYDEAFAAIDHYLGFELEPYYRAQALHRKADIHYRLKQYDEAEKLYKAAVKADGYKPSKRRLEMIKDKRKAGEI